jgi:hypothetical protein
MKPTPKSKSRNGDTLEDLEKDRICQRVLDMEFASVLESCRIAYDIAHQAKARSELRIANLSSRIIAWKDEKHWKD